MSLHDWLLQYEPIIRLAFFISLFALMAIWEIAIPLRASTQSRAARWLNNISLLIINAVLLRLIFPGAVIAMAAFSHSMGWGLLNYYAVPSSIAVIVAVVALDLTLYAQHILMHSVPVLWRIHQVHHADLDFDLTTGLRFHPLEMVFSTLLKFIAIVLIGPPLIAVIAFEVLLNGVALFNHANVHIPKKIDRVLRWFVVTPGMHRVHHSIDEQETNSNFALIVPWWDRLFGHYRAQPRAGHINMTIGIHNIRNRSNCISLPGMLFMPFIAEADRYTEHWHWYSLRQRLHPGKQP